MSDYSPDDSGDPGAPRLSEPEDKPLVSWRDPWGPIFLYHQNCCCHEQYLRGVPDMVGYWAEYRLFGGVVLFDRGEAERSMLSRSDWWTDANHYTVSRYLFPSFYIFPGFEILGSTIWTVHHFLSPKLDASPLWTEIALVGQLEKSLPSIKGSIWYLPCDHLASTTWIWHVSILNFQFLRSQD